MVGLVLTIVLNWNETFEWIYDIGFSYFLLYLSEWRVLFGIRHSGSSTRTGDFKEAIHLHEKFMNEKVDIYIIAVVNIVNLYTMLRRNFHFQKGEKCG